ncbi:hypothetical protein [Paenibacillus sp. IHBB 3054]|uniref:hypothetical protein n=1 Tax=Paenibacillus sp. IHBB 3054 TaxID=3425689 RepID=UPI003F664DC7
MTQTPRDWQKDMDMCKAQEGDQWYNNGNRLEEYDRLTEEGCRPIAEFEREEEAAFAAECREALPYWLQEAKIYQQSYEATLTHYTAEKARADDAEIWRDKAYNKVGHQAQEILELRTALRESEAREQRLKKLLEKIDDETRDEWIGVMIKELLSTLYPDTPAQEVGNDET